VQWLSESPPGRGRGGFFKIKNKRPKKETRNEVTQFRDSGRARGGDELVS
jgi:hypothetical protein